MCYNPAISLSTAIIEFLLGIFLPLWFTKATLRYFFSLFIVLLGFYQLTEFFICKDSHVIFWATAGFVAYSFLPALGLHALLYYSKMRYNLIALYIIPFIYSFLAITANNFITEGVCQTVFVIVKSSLFPSIPFLNFISGLAYSVYYAGFIIIVCAISLRKFLKSKSKSLYLLPFFAIMLMTVPTFVLICIFPYLDIMFPSILCHFALLLAIVVSIGLYLEEKYERKRQR